MLLFTRRFGPFFAVQFGGAFIDNFYKSAMLVFMTQHLANEKLSLFSNISAALFIAPMIILSAWSGLLADGREKRGLILAIKLFEVGIVACGIAAFFFGSIWLMMAILCLLGLQSTFFGPVKYSLLPERFSNDELMLANGLIEAGTFIAILAGTLLGSYFLGESVYGWFYGGLIAMTACGFIAALFVPRGDQPAKVPLPPFQPLRQTGQLLAYVVKQKTVFQCILAISWFWLIGSVFLTQIPQFTSEYLRAGTSVMIYFLALFSIGIGVGSLLANVLARGRVEAGLVPFGAFLMALGMAGFIAFAPGKGEIVRATALTFAEFVRSGRCYGLSASILLLAVASGIYTVPLYALVQSRSEAGKKAQVIAANNIINSIFMVLVALLSVLVLVVLGRSIGELIAIMLGLHIAISVYIFTIVPEFILRLIVITITGILYRVRVEGREHIPAQGAAVLVCNHISYLDAFLLMGASRRPLRFIMYYKIFAIPGLKQIFRLARAIPIAARHEKASIFREAFISAQEELEDGHIVAIFPEGGLTRDGEIAPFKGGVNLILAKNPVPVIPVAICGMWGSFFSHAGAGVFKGRRKMRQRITIRIGAPLPAESSAEALRAAVLKLHNNE